MADVFQEVDEMMKRERLERFWKKNGRWVIAFVLLTIVLTGAVSAYKSWNKSVKERQTAHLIEVLDAPDFPEGVEEKTADLRAPLRTIALLSAAQRYQDNDESEKALGLYKSISSERGVPQEFRHIAVLMATRLDQAMETTAKLETLESVYSDTSSPWRYHAYIQAALLEVHANENFAAARKLLANVKTAQAIPASLKEKAGKLDHVYAVKQDIKNQSEEEGS